MLRIRLQRIGRNGQPIYRIVVAQHTAPAKGKFIERLGAYSPARTPKVFELDTKKVEEWIKKGAKPSSTLARILKGRGMKGMESYIDPMPARKKKGASEEAAAAPAPAAAPAAEPTK